MDGASEAWLLLRSFAALVAVTALAFVVLRFGLPWLMRYRAAARPRSLDVTECVPLDRSHRLYVVSWNDSRLLIATSPERVSLLAEKPLASAGEGVAGESFDSTLERMGRASPPEGGK